jgi:hypothetical protein
MMSSEAPKDSRLRKPKGDSEIPMLYFDVKIRDSKL